MLVTELRPETGRDVILVPIEDPPKSQPLLETAANETSPELSPDGHWLAYASDESGQMEVYVRSFPEVEGGRSKISTAGGRSPVWSQDERELFYRSGDAVLATAIATEPTFRPGAPRALFRGRYLMGLEFRAYDIAPDGERFLMVKPVGDEEGLSNPNQIVIVRNWFSELQARVPTGR